LTSIYAVARMRHGSARATILLLILASCLASSGSAQSSPAWAQWGQNAQHTGNSSVAGQIPQAKLGDVVFDPFVTQETAESRGSLLMHYQAPLVNGNNIYMEFKSGTYVSCNPPGSGMPFPCGPDAWNNEIWNEADWQLQNGQWVQVWSFATDWVPVPNSGTSPSTHRLGGWEPLFQPALSGQYICVPGAGGTIYQLNQSNGSVVSQINPFGIIDPSKFVWGPLTADSSGNIYYNVVQVNLAWPWDMDAVNSWLVKVGVNGSTNTVTYPSLLPGAPTSCLYTFSQSQLPWPPSQNAVPSSIACGSQRPSLNVSPAISADGSTLYTVSRAHFTGRTAYLLALNTSDLSLQWSMSLRNLLEDGCNILLPPDGQPGGCSIYGSTGVDPTQNTMGAAMADDTASASPVVAPDGSILFGADTAYNYGRGHLLQFNSQGQFQATYDFGWDSTPAIYTNSGSYSVILKDNHYDNGSYCSNPTWCPKAPRGPYYMTQLDSNLVIQWQFQDPTVGKGHPDGYEWCVNAPVVDINGVVYGTNEDGYLYVMRQGGTSAQKIFLEQSIDAGYTPLSMGGDGTIYAENAGHLIAVGRLLASTATITSSSQNPSTYGNVVTFTAQVTAGGATPTGSVTFKRGTTKLGTATLSNSFASYTTTPTQLPAGTQSITAVYSGDSTHAGSTSPVFTQTVNKATTTTALTSQPNPSTAGQSVTLTATVSATAGTPAGNVQFKAGRTILGTASLSSGVATLNYTFTQAGTFTIQATYQGSANYLNSSGTVKQQVQP
jgi:Bacterial Ig-like domain (group 3)